MNPDPDADAQAEEKTDHQLFERTISWSANPAAADVVYTRSEFTYDGLGRRVRIVEKRDTRLPNDICNQIS